MKTSKYKVREKCIKCNDRESYVKNMCRQCYWNNLYHTGRIHTKNGRGKARPIPITYYDQNLNIRPLPYFILDGTSNF